jgi:hypothetical protein
VDTPGADDRPTAAAAASAATVAAAAAGGGGGVRADLWSPVDGLQWGMTQQDVDRVIRSAGWDTDRDTGSGGGLTVRNVELAGVGEAQVRLIITGGQLVGMIGTYRTEPPIQQAIDVHSEQLGEPATRELSENAFDISRVVWQPRDPAAGLEVTLSSTQGNTSIQYRLADR